MQLVQIISLTLLSILAVRAQTIEPGKCPDAAVQKDFDIPKYLGQWYEIQKLPNSFQKGECSQATYTLKSEGVVAVLNEELLSDGSVSSIVGSATPKDPSEPAKLLVTFFEGVPPGNYWVLSTDYDNYALVYGCTDVVGVLRAEFAWILSRTRSLPAETVAELRAILASNGVKVDKLTVTDQSNCSAMPE